MEQSVPTVMLLASEMQNTVSCWKCAPVIFFPGTLRIKMVSGKLHEGLPSHGMSTKLNCLGSCSSHLSAAIMRRAVEASQLKSLPHRTHTQSSATQPSARMQKLSIVPSFWHLGQGILMAW